MLRLPSCEHTRILNPYCQHQTRHFSFYTNLHRCSFEAFFGRSFYSSFISYLRRFWFSFYNMENFSTAQRTSVRGSFYTNLQTATRWAARGCGLSAPGRARVSVRLPRHHTKEHKRSRCAPALRASAHPAKPGRLAVPLRSTATQAAGRLGRSLAALALPQAGGCSRFPDISTRYYNVDTTERQGPSGIAAGGAGAKEKAPAGADAAKCRQQNPK